MIIAQALFRKRFLFQTAKAQLENWKRKKTNIRANINGQVAFHGEENMINSVRCTVYATTVNRKPSKIRKRSGPQGGARMQALPEWEFGRVDVEEAVLVGEHLQERLAECAHEQHRARKRGVERALRERAERASRLAQAPRQLARVHAAARALTRARVRQLEQKQCLHARRKPSASTRAGQER